MGRGKVYSIGRKKYSSEDFSSFVIRSIVDDAKKYVADMEGVSIVDCFDEAINDIIVLSN